MRKITTILTVLISAQAIAQQLEYPAEAFQQWTESDVIVSEITAVDDQLLDHFKPKFTDIYSECTIHAKKLEQNPYHSLVVYGCEGNEDSVDVPVSGWKEIYSNNYYIKEIKTVLPRSECGIYDECHKVLSYTLKFFGSDTFTLDNYQETESKLQFVVTETKSYFDIVDDFPTYGVKHTRRNGPSNTETIINITLTY